MCGGFILEDELKLRHSRVVVDHNGVVEFSIPFCRNQS